DLSAYKGMVPEELFGHTEFPSIGELPYFITLGPHDFYWFRLQPGKDAASAAPEQTLPALQGQTLDDLLQGRVRTTFANALGRYIRQQRWFASKTRDINTARIVEVIPVDEASSAILFVRLEYQEGAGETYLIPVACAGGEQAANLPSGDSTNAIARLRARDQEGLVYEATWNRNLSITLLQTVLDREHLKGTEGTVHGWSAREFRNAGDTISALEPSVLKAEQSNTAIVYGDRFFLKLFRRLESGVSTDFEISRFLTGKTDFKHIPRLVGALEYRREKSEPSTVAIVQQAIPNHGDAWKHTLDALGQAFERAISFDQLKLAELLSASESPLDLLERDLPPMVADLLGTYTSSADQMGRRIGELHVALASRNDDPAFRPEPFTPHYQRSIYQHMRTQATQAFAPLKKRLRDLPDDTRKEAEQILAAEGEIREKFRSVLEGKITALRTRLHGDLHLGQILYTGKDFVIIDFEGEPSRPLSERRIKRSPLRDVAGMLRSFQYASYAVLMGQAEGVSLRQDDAATLEPAARLWHRWISAVFLKSYLRAGAAAEFLPNGMDEVRTLLDAYLLEKALYELSYELNNRPTWVRIPLRGMLELLESGRV
ncbi:MAG TPA: putative maltokinase, partial [Thermoanaerobaculia bacterium]|nr:putative maltokinase [Thermoanaerobaculia bacterium]